jgi:hypothetical protein
MARMTGVPSKLCVDVVKDRLGFIKGNTMLTFICPGVAFIPYELKLAQIIMI